MSYELTILCEGDFISVCVTGARNDETSRDLWTKVASACREHRCNNILGVSNLITPISTMKAFEYPKLFNEVGITPRHRIAWVEQNPENLEMAKFTETVLFNRGSVIAKIFTDVAEAKSWLLGPDDV